MTMISGSGNYEDQGYEKFLGELQKRFTANIKDGAEPLFTTDADPDKLWESYLEVFPPELRQHYNCHACRHFIKRYAGLVTIDDMGRTKAAILDSGLGVYELAIDGMLRIVRKAKVTGIFLSSVPVLGEPVTGVWRHIAVQLPPSMLHQRMTLTANQMMSERHEDFLNVIRALTEYKLPMLETALTLLKTDSLYRSEKVIGPAQWLHDLQLAKATSHHQSNSVWRAVAVAPSGFCHPRASMVGTLLDDIAAGMLFEDVSRRFKAKMHPLLYQRPQAPPSAGTIAQAEKVMATLGAAGSLQRRFARIEDIPLLWRPWVTESAKPAGVFGHLRTKADPQMDIPAITMTWEKFSRTVIPIAEKIDFYARATLDHYAALVTAVDPKAPLIFQWDNAVSWYVWHGGSTPAQFGLQLGQWHPVSGVARKPSMWGAPCPQQGEGVIFLIEGARDTRSAGAAIFPETLRSEFHGIRSVIEAYSRSAKIEGQEEASACGILLQKGNIWGHRFRITSKGQQTAYLLDRWD